jgi:hypothetical protein
LEKILSEMEKMRGGRERKCEEEQKGKNGAEIRG